MSVRESVPEPGAGTKSVSGGTAEGAMGGGRPGLSWWQAGGIAIVAATLANLAVLGIGHVLGGSFVFDEANGVHEITAWTVVQFSVAPLAIGFGAAVLLALAWIGFLRLAQVVGGALALATIAGAFMSDGDLVTQLALSVMHIVAGAAVVWALEAVRRRQMATRNAPVGTN
ncbi:hypothetical protein F4561_005914 [Lipingzhangella halophila]|uniref:Uncharacterized protein n=1 Tax=Lipingzhangella halophila TaxID=1783352 RepID=A0A7W7RN35_9ACTN|nr:DUF6069 family protein [Lipingzhangella halophila]MBB4935020.1 hypothetical protein [Lipingzhangella halophila]